MEPRDFAERWRQLSSHDDKHVRAIARRLSSEPSVTKYFPYNSQSNVHLSRSDAFPWEGDGLPFIAVRDVPEAPYQAHDGDFRLRARGDLETVVRAFLELLDEWERVPNHDERRSDVVEKSLKRCHTLLSRWTGAHGQITELTRSHRMLCVDLSRAGEADFLRLACLDPFWISGPVRWSNATIEVTRIRVPGPNGLSEHEARLRRLMDDEDGFLVRDEEARLEVVCGSIEIGEHVHPWRT